MQDATFPHNPLERVHEGMTVVDTSGRKLGKVDYVKMGDPQAATDQGNAPASSEGAVVAPPMSTGGAAIGGVGIPFVPGSGDEPDVRDPLRSRLLRVGFVKVDGPGLTDDDRYFAADMVDRVSEDTVYLRVPEEHIPHEA